MEEKSDAELLHRSLRHKFLRGLYEVNNEAVTG